MIELFPDSLDDLIAEAERELKMREKVYPGLISRGRLTAAAAETQMRRQRGIIAQLKDDKFVLIGGMG